MARAARPLWPCPGRMDRRCHATPKPGGPGGSATYTIKIAHTPSFTEAVSLQVGPTPSPDLNITYPNTINFAPPGGQTSLTLTDTHGPSFSDTVLYSVPITATGGGFVRTANLYLLVNGKQAYVPMITK